MKILTVVGARPQFIKAAVVSREFAKHPNTISEILVHTGQHYDPNMSDIFFTELNIPKPNYNLGIGGGSHGQNTGRSIEKIEELILLEKPDWVLVYGDTDSTLAGALAASKLHIPVAHVEAGLRSFNRKMPEEINRVLTDHVSNILFTPTSTANQNLKNEGISDELIAHVGDVMCDATYYYKKYAQKPVWFDSLALVDAEFVLCTIHRAENTDDDVKLLNIFSGLEGSKVSIILPLHPRTRNKLTAMNFKIPKNVRIVDPVGYLEMCWLEENAKLIVTDSGGVQKEAYFHSKHCVTLRDETEWIELVDGGYNTIVGSNPILIESAINYSYEFISNSNLYGEGKSAAKIVARLLNERR